MNMKRLWLIILMGMSVFILPIGAHAQKIKHLHYVPELANPLFYRFAPLNTKLQRSLLHHQKVAADIRLSVARLDHACLLDSPMKNRPHCTAFLFTTRYKGNREYWAVTAAHTAQKGEKLRLTFYNGKKEIPVDGTLVQQGPALLSDAALIKLDNPLLVEKMHLRPFELTTQVDPQEKLTTWGYASNKLYQINNLTFEKDNTRFLRTTFPAEQTKRAGLCGGPLLNSKGQALGIHCGSTWEDKAYATSVRIIPYLLQAYYEGDALIPIVAKEIEFGKIHINERIIYVQSMDEQGHLLNQEETYDQLPQSLIMALYQDPEVRYLRFIVGSYREESPVYRVLVYDKKTHTRFSEPLRRQQNLYE